MTKCNHGTRYREFAQLLLDCVINKPSYRQNNRGKMNKSKPSVQPEDTTSNSSNSLSHYEKHICQLLYPYESYKPKTNYINRLNASFVSDTKFMADLVRIINASRKSTRADSHSAIAALALFQGFTDIFKSIHDCSPLPDILHLWYKEDKQTYCYLLSELHRLYETYYTDDDELEGEPIDRINDHVLMIFDIDQR